MIKLKYLPNQQRCDECLNMVEFELDEEIWDNNDLARVLEKFFSLIGHNFEITVKQSGELGLDETDV
jgi:hypothetical protein